jgi:hypothetical protein
VLSIFLFIVFFSFLSWLSYDSHPTSSQHQHSIVATAAATTTPISVEEPEPKLSAAVAEQETTGVSEFSAEEEADIEPVLTEEEAIALAVETTLAADTTPEASDGEQEGSISELIHPNPPDPELVETAIRDALEKSEDFSPPESVDA